MYYILRGWVKGCNGSITAIMCQVGYLICVACLVTYILYAIDLATIVRSLGQCIQLLAFYNYVLLAFYNYLTTVNYRTVVR